MILKIKSKKDQYKHFVRTEYPNAIDCYSDAGDSRLELYFQNSPRILIPYYRHDLPTIVQFETRAVEMIKEDWECTIGDFVVSIEC